MGKTYGGNKMRREIEVTPISFDYIFGENKYDAVVEVGGRFLREEL